MKLVALRRGRKRALHIPVVVERLSERNYALLKLYSGERLGSYSGAELPEGSAYLVVMPRVEKGREYRISELSSRDEKLSVELSAAEERLALELDNRGRAGRLSEKLRYSVRVVPWKRFYELFERRSIPAEESSGRRSEPDALALRRMAAIERMLTAEKGLVFDSATGIKSYLRVIRDSNLVCGNISTTILRRVREWLGTGSFLAYDVERIPLREESFDLVIVDALLEYVERAREALRSVARLVRRGGKLVLLEPIEAERRVSFYPQDLWELAIWRPLADRSFSRQSFHEVLRSEGFERLSEVRLEFEYEIFEKEKFTQRVALYGRFNC